MSLKDELYEVFFMQNFSRSTIYVTEPAKVDHVNANYTELYFRNMYLSFRMQYPISISYRGKPINSAVLMKISLW